MFERLYHKRVFRGNSCLAILVTVAGLTGGAALTVPVVAHAMAVGRTFPQPAQRGKLALAQFPEAVLDGKATRLAPGVRIWGPDNRQVLPAALGSATYTVNYTVDLMHQPNRVWILTDPEIAQDIRQQRNSMRF